MTRKVFFGFMFLAALPCALFASKSTPLTDNWQLQSGCKITAGGEAISTAQFTTEGWIKTPVPSTVLAAQVKANIFPDPYFGSNLRQIPGTSYPIGHNFANLPMPPDSPYACGWWYRTEFATSPLTQRDNRLWLHFGGINYRGEIWMNGHRVADASTIAGAYRTYDFDVTDLVTPGKANVLAVKTTAPTEKDLGINWVDWNPCPPDKDMGLWGPVNLVESGPVTVRSPMVVTHFPNGSTNRADLTVYAELHNTTGAPIQGVLSGMAAGVHFEKAVQLGAKEDQTVAITSDQVPALRIQNPKLWWPRQMGEPHLEQLTVAFNAQGGTMDEQSIRFGIREITSELTPNGSRLFRVNGRPILIRGAGWSQDMLLRTDENRLSNQLKLVQDMNLNTIRLEGKLETDEFFRLTDERGILVMLGWCCCDHWEHWKEWTPQDLTIATESLRSQMLRLRHHASLLVWLNGSDNPPIPDVEKAYLQVEADTKWPNPVLSSATAAVTTVTGETGVKMTGPYDYVAPSYWYFGLRYGGAIGYNTETSPGPAIPSLASRKRFLPDPEAWPPSPNWTLHNGGGEFANLKVFNAAMEAVYARPQSADDYERMAQTMEYDSERAMFEAYSRNKYTSTGVIQWMLNNAWPSMIWHLYDYYLDAGGGYFGTKKACEPLHIQYSYDNRSVDVVNSTYSDAPNLRATVHVYGLKWNELYKAEEGLSATADSAQRVFTIPAALYEGTERIFFIDLALSDATGKVVSHNFYWVPGTLTTFDWENTDYTHTPAMRHPDLTALTQLPPAHVDAHASFQNTPHGRQLRLDLSNHSTALAFQVRAALRTSTGDLIAPVLWSDNWIELKPGESTTLTAQLPDAGDSAPVVHVDGWNVAPITVNLTTSVASR